MLRRLYHEQPDSFAFTPANLEWARGQMEKYPEGRQASAVIPLLWRAQEQEGWVTRPAIEEIARMLGLAYIRVLEVATFYFMFQLQPVGSVAHVQVCGTTSCMICGAEDLIAVCKRKIAPNAHQLSPDGKLSWEEVECLGACANAPMAQIGKDYYEDLTVENFGAILDALARGDVPRPGPQNGRFASEPLGGTVLPAGERTESDNASVALALALGDTVARITGEPGARAPRAPAPVSRPVPLPTTEPATPGEPEIAAGTDAIAAAEPRGGSAPVAERLPYAERDPEAEAGPEPLAKAERSRPVALREARAGAPDDLKRIKGVGQKLEVLLHSLGIWHLDQIAAWGPAELAWIDDNLEGFHGRASRDDWVGQARRLVAGSEAPQPRSDGPGDGA